MFVKSITAGPGIDISSSCANDPPCSGPMVWDNNLKMMKVVDPTSYNAPIGVPTNLPTISLDNRTQMILTWAEKKMREDQELSVLCNKHPGLEDARREFELMRAMCRESTS